MRAPSVTVPAARRLVLSVGEYRQLVELSGVDMPPGWGPDENADSGAAAAQLTTRGVLEGEGDRLSVHPSVLLNLRILAGPMVMVDTTASIGSLGSRSLHAVAGELGASLFALEDGAVELSMFTAVTLGQELIRAVPVERDTGIASRLGDTTNLHESPGGRVPLDALHELGVAELLARADPLARTAVTERLDLPADQAELVERAGRSDGGLQCVVTARIGEQIASTVVVWLHGDSGWVGLLPDPDGSGQQMVRLIPAAREDLGTWVAPMIAGALS
ncbi:MAG: ESX secretion-associated protein EspG [Pseudonocardiaceae bacterium]